ncbi:MAG: methylated-DNA--[protein]-cysteine S-methyltransferase [Bacteriovoracaceae bacterium]
MKNLRTLYFRAPIGIIGITGHDKKITEIRLIRNQKTFKNDLSFPHLDEAKSQILDYFANRRKKFNLPIEKKGTEFQHSVWELIEAIPHGETKSYGELAKQLGSIHKARAVGAACNRNKLLIVVPCHRVMGAKGEIVGFSVGRDIKKMLLEQEV